MGERSLAICRYRDETCQIRVVCIADVICGPDTLKKIEESSETAERQQSHDCIGNNKTIVAMLAGNRGAANDHVFLSAREAANASMGSLM